MPGAQGGIDFLLEPYRVLDLTDERGLLAGKILADMGADVPTCCRWSLRAAVRPGT